MSNHKRPDFRASSASAQAAPCEETTRPALQFYPADWLKNPELKTCAAPTRAVFFHLLCVMHSCKPYGHLTINGRAMSEPEIRSTLADLQLTPRKVRQIMAELAEKGLLRATPDGILYSRRMVRDETKRGNRANGGKAGGVHGYKGAPFGVLGGRPRKTPDTPPPEPPASPEQRGVFNPPPSPTRVGSLLADLEARTAERQRPQPQGGGPLCWPSSRV